MAHLKSSTSRFFSSLNALQRLLEPAAPMKLDLEENRMQVIEL